MKIEKNKVVALTYELIVDGKIADKADETRPLDYIHGNHMLLAKFEEYLEGLTEGDPFAFTLSPEEGYGVYDEKRVIMLPKEAFMIEGVLHEELMEVGRTLPMMGADGSVVYAVVKEVTPEGVAMDFNAPMAGKTLNFTGKIVSVRDATEKELREGLHGEYLPREEEHCRHGKGRCHKDDPDHECCHKDDPDHECCHKDDK